MIKKTFHGATTSDANEAVLNAIEKFNEYVMSKFNNVTVEIFTKTNGSDRYIYSIDGLENLYFCLENSTAANNWFIWVSLMNVDQIYSTNNPSSTSTSVKSFLNGTTIGNINTGANLDAYFISYNGRLKAFGVNVLGQTAPLSYVINQNGERWFVPVLLGDDTYSNSRPAYKDEVGIPLQYLSQSGDFVYSSIDTTALMRNAMIVSDSSSAWNGTFVAVVADLYNILNEQFKGGRLTLISIGGVRYRQIAGQYLFALDGDTE